MGATVVGRGDGSETLLAGGIPLLRVSGYDFTGKVSVQTYNLKLDGLSIEFDGSDFLRPNS